MTSYNNRMMTDYHLCPARHCPRMVPNHQALCREHWLMVPSPIQRDLYRAWNNGDPTEDHPGILRTAVGVVDGKLGH